VGVEGEAGNLAGVPGPNPDLVLEQFRVGLAQDPASSFGVVVHFN
jgi:hypothetical protein